MTICKYGSFIFFFILVFVSFSSQNAFSQSMTGGGGGNAVACFKNAEIAFQAISKDGELKQQAYNTILTFEMLDYWESSFGTLFFQPNSDETPQQFLVKILNEKWRPYLPELVNKILETLKIFESAPTDFEEKQTVKTIYDTGKIERPLPPWCKVVGVINRYTDSNPGFYPRLNIKWSRKLYNRLALSDENTSFAKGVLNQAILLLHETLYILGHERGDENSHDIRYLVRLLLSNNIFKQLEVYDPEIRPFAFQTLEVTYKVDRLLSLFQKEYSVNQSHNRYTKETRALSWNSFLSKEKACGKKWMVHNNIEDANLIVSSTYFGEASVYIAETCLPDLLTDEEAFLARATGYALLKSIRSRDVFITPGEDDTKDFHTICEKLLTSIPNFLGEKKINDKAQRYCTDVKRNLSYKTDQRSD